jgi:hypothetical protein
LGKYVQLKGHHIFHRASGVNECFAALSDTRTVAQLNWRASEGEKSTALGMRIAEVRIPALR